MGYKCTFMDNEVYTADDVNRMFSALTTEGVVLADSGMVLNDFNDAVSEITTAGVQYSADSCKLVCTDGIYKISEGICFTEDGAAITFDSDGYEITPLKNAVSYVYIQRNAPYNTIDVVVSDEPGDEETVSIAEVDENGNISDTRSYAKARVMLTQGNTLQTCRCRFEANGTFASAFDAGSGNFSKIIILNASSYNASSGSSSYFIPSGYNAHDIEDGKTLSVSMSVNGINSLGISFTKSGQYINISLSRYSSSCDYEVNFEIV